jgi:hypothetical protein
MNKWEVTEYPKELNRIKTIFDWREYPNDFKKICRLHRGRV